MSKVLYKNHIIIHKDSLVKPMETKEIKKSKDPFDHEHDHRFIEVFRELQPVACAPENWDFVRYRKSPNILRLKYYKIYEKKVKGSIKRIRTVEHEIDHFYCKCCRDDYKPYDECIYLLPVTVNLTAVRFVASKRSWYARDGENNYYCLSESNMDNYREMTGYDFDQQFKKLVEVVKKFPKVQHNL